MKALAMRVGALEERVGTDERPRHQILVQVGQNEADAIAAYEARNGCSVGDDNLIMRQIVEVPQRQGAY